MAGLINFRIMPWFIYDIYNFQLITSNTIPSDIRDEKSIIMSETPIVGLNYSPVNTGGMGNRKIGMTLPLVKRNNSVGNVLLLKQFDMLRNQSSGLRFGAIPQFQPNPKVLYFWGAGQGVPMVYYVERCNYVHKSGFVNYAGYTQYSEIELSLIEDATDPTYIAEDLFRRVSAIIGETVGFTDLFVDVNSLTARVL